MSKCFKILSLLAFLTLIFSEANAIIKYEDRAPNKIKDIKVTGFLNYAPFGYNENPESIDNKKFNSVFLPVIDKFAKENELKIQYVNWMKDYSSTIQAVRGGQIDIVLGMYHETQLYRGLDYIFPAIVVNPITIFVRPDRIEEIKKLTDLKNLKGARSSNEYLSDYVNEEIAQYNLEVISDSNEMFEKLFTKKIDYIMGSQSFIMIEASKIGVRKNLGIAKQTVWSMPMFIGVSKLSRYRNFLTPRLGKLVDNKEMQDEINKHLIEMVNDVEKKYEGVVPPAYSVD